MRRSKIQDYFERRWEFLLLICISLLAFFLRRHFLVTYIGSLTLHEQDAIGYISIAKGFLHLQPLSDTYQPPGYPVIIALFSLLPLDYEQAARVASMTMDALVVFPLYGLAKRVSRPAGFAAAVLWACFSYSLVFTPSPLSQSTYLFFLLTGTYLLFRAIEEDGKPGWFLLAGISFGWSYLSRPEGLAGFGGALLLALALSFFKNTRKELYLAKNGTLLAGFLLLAAPYWLFLHRHLGYWTFTGKTEVAIKGVDATHVVKGGEVLHSTGNGLSLFLQQYGGVSGALATVYHNLEGFQATFLRTFPLWVLLIGLLGVPLVVFKAKGRVWPYLLIPLFATTPVYIANLPKQHSYIYPVFAVFLMLVGVGCEKLAASVVLLVNKAKALKPLWSGALTAVLLIIPLGYLGFQFFLQADYNFHDEGYLQEAMSSEYLFKESGMILRTVSGKDDPVVSRWGLVGYFASRPLIILPKGDVQEVLAFSRKSGAKYLMIDTVSVMTRRQELAELLNPLYGRPVNPAYRLLVVAARGHESVGGYVVYRIL